ncbi:MAG: hypothetical protein ABIW03_01470 [Sphingomicrobium sp.]
MAFELFITAIVVAAIAAATAVMANKRWPQRTIRQLLDRIITWLVLGTFVLMAVGCALVLRTGCAPDDHVCDGPAMAAAGVTILGAMLVAAAVVVGTPVAYLVLKVLRR